MAKATKSATVPYYRRYEKELTSTVQEYQSSRNAPGLFAAQQFAALNSVEKGITRHPLREYQMEALFLMDHLLTISPTKPIVKDLLEVVDDDTKKKAPFMSFEMATGSGKTMLMGAAIYLLNQKRNIRNFLIITPASTDIYQKTIRNFSLGGIESVWADDTPFTFNLITGDNYTQKLFYKEENNANIFVFNIAKFGKNATNTGLTWEDAIWKDDEGNSISIKEYLKDKPLAIITDEAHHAQTSAAQKIIKNFHPDLVLEYTATAVETAGSTSKADEKKSQTIIYKYDIRRFLEDGYGKLVRAVALAPTTNSKSKADVSPDEKLKLITLALIHLLKRQAILQDPKARQLKPLAFVKVKDDTIYTQKVFDYLVNDLPTDTENLQVILDKIKQQELQITDLLRQIWEQHYEGKADRLQHDLRQFTSTTIFYHGKSDKATEQRFREIRTNNVELVVYMQRLDEGIDLPNIFTMAVINDSASDFKTSVKQIIGRGIRLYKDHREFDDLEALAPLKACAEKLHIVCDQGKNFEEVILSIQQEFGLSDKYFSYDRKQETITNQAKAERLLGKYLPHIRADFRAKSGVNLLDLVKDVNTIVDHFIEDNCFHLPPAEGGEDGTGSPQHFLKYRPDGFFLEVDIFANPVALRQQIQQNGWTTGKLTLTERERKAIYGIVQKTLYVLPDTPSVRESFQGYLNRFNEIGLCFPQLTDSDKDLAANLFVHAFSSFYRHYIEKNYFWLNFERITGDQAWDLSKKFTNYELKLPQDQIGNDSRVRVRDRDQVLKLIDANYHFHGYEHSIYDYDKFDSYPEHHLAAYVNEILKVTDNQPFWVRNQRNVWFTYGSKRYYPDFIVYRNGWIFVIEVKGEKFSDVKKNALLSRLNDYPAEELAKINEENGLAGDQAIKGYRGILVFETLLDRMGSEQWDFDRFIQEAEDFLARKQSIEELELNPVKEEQYRTYIPAYSPDNAYRFFHKQQRTPKPDGWKKMPLLLAEARYPETVFAVQVKGNALSPQHEANSWVVLQYPGTNMASALGHLSLVYNKDIKDEYEGTITLRTVSVQERSSSGLFSEKDIHLTGYHTEAEPIIIRNIGAGNEVVIIGTEWTG